MSEQDSARPTLSTEPPALWIVRGQATDEELAALAAVVAAAGSSSGVTEPAPAPVRGRWNDPARSLRQPWRAGPGGWRAAR